MPYICQSDRNKLDPHIAKLVCAMTAGTTAETMIVLQCSCGWHVMSDRSDCANCGRLTKNMKPVVQEIAIGTGDESSRKGTLNYVITRLILDLIGGDVRYSKINDVVGALECCKLELYRRLAAPYEDKKIKENGDVYL